MKVTVAQAGGTQTQFETAIDTMKSLPTEREQMMFIRRLTAGQIKLGDLTGQQDRTALEQPFVGTQRALAKPAAVEVFQSIADTEFSELKNSEEAQEKFLKDIAKLSAGVGLSQKLQALGLDPTTSTQVGFTVGTKAGEKMAEAFIKALENTTFADKLRDIILGN